MAESSPGRESVEKIYTHNLPSGIEVWDAEPMVNEPEHESYFTSVPWKVAIKGADRKGKIFVKSVVQEVVGAQRDGNFVPGSTAYLRQIDLNTLRERNDILRQVAATADSAQESAEEESYVQKGMEGMHAKPWELDDIISGKRSK